MNKCERKRERCENMKESITDMYELLSECGGFLFVLCQSALFRIGCLISPTVAFEMSRDCQTNVSRQRHIKEGIEHPRSVVNNVIHSCLSGETINRYGLFCFDLVRVADPSIFLDASWYWVMFYNLSFEVTKRCLVFSLLHTHRSPWVLSTVSMRHSRTALCRPDDNWCPTFLLSVLGSPWTKNGPVTCRPSFIRPRWLLVKWSLNTLTWKRFCHNYEKYWQHFEKMVAKLWKRLYLLGQTVQRESFQYISRIVSSFGTHFCPFDHERIQETCEIQHCERSYGGHRFNESAGRRCSG